ncbi:MAG: molybdopterin-containing oxidoreductase family protein [Candidatus Kryptoniota bacterium]
MHINRRDFVKLLGGSLIGFAAGGAGEALFKLPNAILPILYNGPKTETWKLTTCAKCPGACGLRIRLIDGLPVQAFGNPLSPVNKGGVCPMGLTSVESLYHPDRIMSPMKKVNGKFQEISYADAYGAIASELRKVVGHGDKNSIAFIAQTESLFMANLIQKFMDSIGSGKLVIDNFAAKSRLPYEDLKMDYPDFIDFDHIDYLLNFGSQMTEVSESPLFFSRAVNSLRERKGKLVTIAPKLTPSAFKASRWIPAMPRDFADVALAIAFVIISDGTYDKMFVQNHFRNFETFRKLVLENYTPFAVQARVGVDAEQIISTAREFANAGAPAAYFDETILHSSNGLKNAHAIIALNALKGFAGFGKINEAGLKDPGIEMSQEGRNTWNKNDLIERSDTGVLLIYRSNFIFNSPNAEEFRKALSRIPLVVSFSPFIDETSELADLIIPDHDDLEKLDMQFSTAIGNPVVSVQQPVVKPFYSTVHTGDVIVSLIGDLNLQENWKYRNYKDYLQAMIKPIYDRGTGMLMSQKKPTGIERSLHKAGWQLVPYSDFEDFWQQLLRYGGWWDPFPKIVGYTPQVALEIDQLEDNKKRRQQTLDGQLRLNIFLKNFDYKGNLLRNPVLTEQFGMDHDVYYTTWVEVNPETAKRLSIPDRSMVKIKTAKGDFEAIALHSPTTMPQNVDVPFGLGHTAAGKQLGTNPIHYSDNVFDDQTGEPSYSETLVKIF